MEQLIISLLSGAAGGNIVGKVLKNLDLGPIGNSIAGILGGGLGSQILASLGSADAAAAGGMDMGSIISSIASGGVGGGVEQHQQALAARLGGDQRGAVAEPRPGLVAEVERRLGQDLAVDQLTLRAAIL